MNEMYYQINRRLNDPLYDAKCTKRQLNKEIKKCRQTIEDYSISIGFKGNTLSDLLRKLDEVNERIEKLKEEN